MRPLSAHSITEAHLYCMVHACNACQADSSEVVHEEIEEEHIDSIVRLECACRSCGRRTELHFRIDSHFVRPQEPPVLNPGHSPSMLIDLAQWLTLHHTLLTRSDGAASKLETLRLRHLAGLCIEEALKFYEPDNDLPPARAFFSDRTREHALRQPEIFIRPALLERRAQLPDREASARRAAAQAEGKWWQFWKRAPTRVDSQGPRGV